MARLLSDQNIAEFQTQGATLLKGVFGDWVGVLRDGVAANMADPDPNARNYETEGGGRFFVDYCNWDRIDQYRDFIFNSPAPAVGAELMGSTCS